MSLLKIVSFDSTLIFELFTFLKNSDFQPPYSPIHGGLLKLGDTPRPPPEIILDFFFKIHKIIWTAVIRDM
jgi:hypothetical protein